MKNEFADPKLNQAGEAIRSLARPQAPRDLASRTLARVMAELAPVKRKWLVLRPITHPVARVLAAASIMMVLFPMTTLDVADPLGSRIEERIVGANVVNRVENFVDRILVRTGPATYSQTDLDA